MGALFARGRPDWTDRGAHFAAQAAHLAFALHGDHIKIRATWRRTSIACYNATMRTADLKFAEILAKATELFGSQQEAEHWLERPAIGLNRHRPIDLLAATPAGAELVETFFSQIKIGVHV